MENNLYDIELESVVLGSMMVDAQLFHELEDILNPDCFVGPQHREVYEAIKQVASTGDGPELMAVSIVLKGKVTVKTLAEMTLKARFGNHMLHAQELYELHVRRKLSAIGEHMIYKSADKHTDIADIASYANNTLSGLFEFGQSNISTIKDAVNGVFSIAERNAKSDTAITGAPTGFSEFDRKSGGLQKGDLIIIAGETSQGKTSLAVSMVRNAAMSESKAAIYSLEMKKEQIAARMMSIESGIPSNEILFSRLSGSQFQCLDKHVSTLCGLGIFFDDRSTSGIDSIIASIRTMKLKHDIDGAVVDYLQILNVNMKGANKEQQMGDVARRLKNLAKDLDIWVIALSQLNRDSGSSAPNLNRLRDSGQIAEAADTVILVYRPEVHGASYPSPHHNMQTKGTAMIDIAKGRNIGLLKFIVSFDAKTTHFKELDQAAMSAEEKSDEPF